MEQQFNILSLSGGGIRGVFTASVLAQLESYIIEEKGLTGTVAEEYSIAQHFDMICGTSIGGIIALSLASGLTAREVAQTMLTHRLTIFPKKMSWLRLFHPLYKAQSLKAVLDTLFQTKRIGELEKYVLVPAISLTNGQIRAFKTPHHPHLRTDYKLSLVDVALATSAAPTYFPVHQIESERFVDGGLAANSPVLMGLMEAKYYLGLPLSDVYVMQVGTMGSKRTSDHSEKRTGGYLKTWEMGKGIIELAMSTTETLHNFLAGKIIEDSNRLLNIDEVPGEKKSSILTLDNASDQAIEILRASAHKVAMEQVNAPNFKYFINHTAKRPTFYHGPKKTKEG
ncbi:CBASS cGAMP-activated phospholipase [Alteromonas oceani]|uniref:CBASS cGAMP-activated phospholipase n=1 Tax=Alteromonas oceani TaxID=2071609 RepID=A0ABV7K0F2_9ALTE|nr:CBASS cGAMP-activated phospholipase [Alteromonas oceani]